MITVEEARKILGEEYKTISDEDVLILIYELETLSNILLDSGLLETLDSDDQ